MTKIFFPILVATSLAMPAAAQDDGAPTPAPGQERSLIEDGARMLFDGLMQEAQPALEEMRMLAERFGPQLREFAEEMGPALAEILEDVEDLSVYAAPEQLPNGDIIIRRKEPLDDVPKDEEQDLPEAEQEPNGEIEI
ncbi:MAG: hypothetical protein WEB56_09250 [Roseovarius sp.]